MMRSVRFLMTRPASARLARERGARSRLVMLAQRADRYALHCTQTPLSHPSVFVPWLRLVVAHTADGPPEGVRKAVPIDRSVPLSAAVRIRSEMSAEKRWSHEVTHRHMAYDAKTKHRHAFVAYTPVEWRSVCQDPAFAEALRALAIPVLSPGAVRDFPPPALIAAALRTATRGTHIRLVQRVLREYEMRVGDTAHGLSPKTPGAHHSALVTMPPACAGLLVARAVALDVHPRDLCGPFPAGGLTVDASVAVAALVGDAGLTLKNEYADLTIVGQVQNEDFAVKRMWRAIDAVYWLAKHATAYGDVYGGPGAELESAVSSFLNACALRQPDIPAPKMDCTVAEWIARVRSSS